MKYWVHNVENTQAVSVRGLQEVLAYCVEMIRVYAACQHSGGQGALKFARQAARTMRQILKVSRHNLCLARKQSLLADPAACRELIDALGGERRLDQWDAAQMRIRARADAHIIDALPKQSPDWHAETMALKRRKEAIRTAGFAPPDDARDNQNTAMQFRLPPLIRRRRKTDPRFKPPHIKLPNGLMGAAAVHHFSQYRLPIIIVSPSELRRACHNKKDRQAGGLRPRSQSLGRDRKRSTDRLDGKALQPYRVRDGTD